MAYSRLTASIAQDWFRFALDPGIAFGSSTIRGGLTPPTIPAIELVLGQLAGQFDLVALASGTLTNVTPGTTDTANIDLKALVDPVGNAITTMVKCVGILTLNLAQDNVSYLTIGPGASNGFTSMFSGVGGVIVPPAHQDSSSLAWKYGFDARLGANLAAYAVSSTNKTIKLTSGSSVSLPYRMIILGRTA